MERKIVIKIGLGAQTKQGESILRAERENLGLKHTKKLRKERAIDTHLAKAKKSRAISDDKAYQVHCMKAKGLRNAEIARQLSINERIIPLMLNGKTYRDIYLKFRKDNP